MGGCAAWVGVGVWCCFSSTWCVDRNGPRMSRAWPGLDYFVDKEGEAIWWWRGWIPPLRRSRGRRWRDGWQKIVAQIRGVFRKIFIYYPLWGQNLAPKHVFTPNFRLHTVTTGSGFRTFRNSFRTFHLLTEIYPLVPFPPSLSAVVSDYTSTPLRWTPLTRADAGDR